MNRADFDLLLGIVALQNGFIDQPALMAAFHVWGREKERSLAEILEERGDLSPSRRALLTALAEERVRQRGGDPGASLAVLRLDGETIDALGATGDEALRVSLSRVGLADTVADDSATASLVSTDARGRFQVLRPHARGGLGVVFVALDSELHREVALKEIQPPHADQPESRARFLLEAEITGGLEHPGIVPVYSLGRDPDGRPFYAMRLIQGESLGESISRFHQAEKPNRDPGERTLELRELLRRFLDVCNAIAYAHSRGVLHRDIKPGNVMVGAFGETLVVDWGLAKIIDAAEPGGSGGALRPPSATEEGHLTRTGSALGTPQFMSPEQAGGELDRLGPRSDVYSLGATLYCLLTGHAPFPSRDAAEVIAQVRRGDFPTPRQVKPPVPPALEAVCLKAMALNPDDRYASPRELAEDLQRWLADEPVSAHREPWTTRAGRWARRHRTLVSTTAAALLVALAALGAGLLLLDQARRREARLNQSLTIANAAADRRLDQTMSAIEDYYTGVSGEVLLTQTALQPLRDRLLARPLEFYQTMTRELESAPADDDRSRFLLAHGRLNLGKILNRLGRREEARDQWRASIALFEPLTKRDPANPSYHEELAGGRANLGAVLADLGDHPGAVAEFQKAIALLDAPAAPPLGQDSDIHRPLIRSGAHCGLGAELATLGDLVGADAAYRRAIDAAAALVKAHPDRPEPLDALARAHNGLGVLLSTRGDARGAVAEFRDVVKAFQGLVKAAPDGAAYRETLARSHSNLGVELQRAGDPDGAVDALRQAVEVAEAVAAAEPNAADPALTLSLCRRNLADSLRRRGDNPGAIQQCRLSVDNLKRQAAAHPEVPTIRWRLAAAGGDLGDLLDQTGDLAGAETQRREVVRLLEDLVGEQPEVADYRNELAIAHTHVGESLTRRGDLEGGAREYRRSIALREALIAEQPEIANHRAGLAVALLDLADILGGAGDPPAALKCIDRAAELADALIRAHPEVTRHRAMLAEARRREAKTRIRANDFSGAKRVLDGGLEIYGELIKVEPKETSHRYATAEMLGLLGVVAINQGDALGALDAFDRSVKALEALVHDHPETPQYRYELAKARVKLGIVRAQTGRPDLGLVDCRKAAELAEALTTAHPQAADYQQTHSVCLASVGMILEAMGRGGEAIPLLESAVAHGRAALDAAPSADEYRLTLGSAYQTLAQSLRAAGRIDEWAAANRQRVGLMFDQPTELYNAACELALCSSAKHNEPAAAEALAGEAVAALRAAVAAGWSNAAYTSADPDLAPLRPRADFQAIVDAMRFPPLPANPFADPD